MSVGKTVLKFSRDTLEKYEKRLAGKFAIDSYVFVGINNTT